MNKKIYNFTNASKVSEANEQQAFEPTLCQNKNYCNLNGNAR